MICSSPGLLGSLTGCERFFVAFHVRQALALSSMTEHGIFSLNLNCRRPIITRLPAHTLKA